METGTGLPGGGSSGGIPAAVVGCWPGTTALTAPDLFPFDPIGVRWEVAWPAPIPPAGRTLSGCGFPAVLAAPALIGPPFMSTRGFGLAGAAAELFVRRLFG